MARQHGITTNTANRLVLDSGALYIDYGETTQTLIGATRGGAVFMVDQEVREIPLDGALGPVKNLRRITRMVPRLTFTLMEFTLARLQDFLPGSSSTTAATNWDAITRATGGALVAGDYLTNVALVAEVSGTTNPVICYVKNALFIQNFSMTLTDKDEGNLPLEAVGHYLDSDLDTEPWEIRWPKS